MHGRGALSGLTTLNKGKRVVSMNVIATAVRNADPGRTTQPERAGFVKASGDVRSTAQVIEAPERTRMRSTA